MFERALDDRRVHIVLLVVAVIVGASRFVTDLSWLGAIGLMFGLWAVVVVVAALVLSRGQNSA